MQENTFDVIIIGAGAAGLMCAQFAAGSGNKVLILDHSHKLAEKIRISGGGRCNFTNLNTAPECYISQNKHFATSALARYTPQHFTELLNQHNITYHEKTLGQLFCDDKSQVIIDLLDFLCRDSGVLRLMETNVENIERSSAGFTLTSSKGIFKSEKLVIATGGLAIPQIGATPFGYQIAEQFGLAIVPTAPALVPLCLQPQQLNEFKTLSGISFDSETSVDKISFRENSLFTHRGLSGPAILQISSYWHPGDKLKLNLLPNLDISQEIESNRNSNKRLSNFLANYFSSRMADSLVNLLKCDLPPSQLNKSQIANLGQLIHNFTVTPSGTEGYKKAEVTRGGVATTELNSKTMMANNVDGLYFIGEVVDVTGHLGGYNFQWAWASAYAAAKSF
ncbi:MAG: NAD(P)/FAD-dependent oxidoreductase [Neisseriaceae bacterium]|nr:MAG: NAD(P)/FAD-dependent oxidoreductase [Neisseriaceae bacterium]